MVESGELGEEVWGEVIAEAEVVEGLDGGAGGGAAEGFGQLGADGDGGEGGLPGVGSDAEEAAEPASGGEAAALHEVLGGEVGAGFVFGAGAVDERKLAALPPGVEGGEEGVEAEEAVEFEEVFAADAQIGAGAVVAVVAVGDHEIESVGATAQEDHYEGAGGVLLAVEESGEGWRHRLKGLEGGAGEEEGDGLA